MMGMIVAGDDSDIARSMLFDLLEKLNLHNNCQIREDGSLALKAAIETLETNVNKSLTDRATRNLANMQESG